MSESVLRSFFHLAYEHLGLLLLVSVLRALPWLLPALLVTFLSPDAIGPRPYAWLIGATILAAVLLAPYLSGGAQHLGASIARGAAPRWRAGLGRRYGILLAWNLVQLLLLAVLLQNLALYLRGSGELHGFALLLSLGAGFWLWALARLWSFHFLPLLIARNDSLRESARLTLLLVLRRPGRVLADFAQRQLLGLLLVLSGLGIFLGLGALPALHAALSARVALRPLGHELAPPGESQENRPLEFAANLRKLWRPWS